MVILLLGCVAANDSGDPMCTALGRVGGVVTMLDQPVAQARVTVWADDAEYEVLADEDGVYSTSALGELRLQPLDNGATCQGPEVTVDLGPCEQLELELELDPDTCVDG